MEANGNEINLRILIYLKSNNPTAIQQLVGAESIPLIVLCIMINRRYRDASDGGSIQDSTTDIVPTTVVPIAHGSNLP